MQSDRTITINLSTGTEVDIVLTQEPVDYELTAECGWNIVESDFDISGLTEAEIIEAEEQAETLRDKWKDELEDSGCGEDSDDEDEDGEDWDE